MINGGTVYIIVPQLTSSNFGTTILDFAYIQIFAGSEKFFFLNEREVYHEIFSFDHAM